MDNIENLDKIEFAKRLKKSIDENGTQKKLAKYTGISEANISKYTNGDSLPNLGTIYILARALRVSIDSLCGIGEKEQYDSSKTVSLEQRKKRTLEMIADNVDGNLDLFTIHRTVARIEYVGMESYETLGKHFKMGIVTNEQFYSNFYEHYQRQTQELHVTISTAERLNYSEETIQHFKEDLRGLRKKIIKEFLENMKMYEK